MTISVALVGLGLAGRGIEKNGSPDSHIGALMRVDSFNLVVAVDPVESTHQDLRKTLPDVQFYSNIGELSKGDGIDLIVFAEPPQHRLENVASVLEHLTPKAVLLEKPIAPSTREATFLVELLREAGVDSFVSFPRRSDSLTGLIKREFFDSGPETSARGHVWYSKDALNSAIHFLNLIDYWAGPLDSSSILRLEKDPRRPTFMVSNEFSIFTFSPTPGMNWVHNGLDVMLPGGRLRYDFGGRVIEWAAPDFPDKRGPIGELVVHTIPGDLENRFVQMYRELYRALSSERNDYALTTGSEALRQQELINRILPR